MMASILRLAVVPLLLFAALAPLAAAGPGADTAVSVVQCDTPADCYVICVLGNPTAPLIYFQCTVWSAYCVRRFIDYTEGNIDTPCPLYIFGTPPG